MPACGGVGTSGPRYQGIELALGDRDYVDDLRVPGMLHGALAPRRPRPGRHRAHRHQSPPRRCRAWSRVFTAADVPGELRVGIIHKDWPIFIPEGGRTSYLGDVLAIVVAEDRETARGRRAAGRGRATTCCRRSPTRSPRSQPGRDDAVWGLDGNVLSRSAYARGDVDAALAAQRARGARGVPDAAHRARLPRARVDARRAGRAPTAPRPARLLGRPGRVGRPRPDRIGARRRRRARSPSSWSRTAARSAARRTWQPGPDRARGLAARPAGEVHALARGALAHPPEAPPDPHGVLGRLRRRRPAHRAAGAHGRRLGRLRHRSG